MPKVSVVIGVYNVEKYLHKCLESVKNQTLEDIEVIMVDDGSTDNSANICREYSDNDPRFHLIRKEQNEGAAASRETGMCAAKGEYLYFLDSDDWIESKLCEIAYTIAQKNDADIVMFNCYEHYEELPDIPGKQMPTYLKDGIYNREEILNQVLTRTLSDFDGQQWTNTIRWSLCLRLFKRPMIVDNNIHIDPKFRRAQDLLLTFECTLCAQKFIYCGDLYLFHQNVRKNSLSKGKKKNLWSIVKPLLLKLYDVCESFNDINLSDQMGVCAYNFAELCIWNEKSQLTKDSFKEIIDICNDPIKNSFMIVMNRIPCNPEKKYVALFNEKNRLRLYYSVFRLTTYTRLKSQLYCRIQHKL